MQLTSRQRVIRTLRREPVDRFPIDLGMHFSTGISVFAYQRLLRHLGKGDRQVTVIDPVQMLAKVDDDIRDLFGVDTVTLHHGWTATKRWAPRDDFAFEIPVAMNPVVQPDGAWTINRNGEHMLMPSGGFFFDGAWPCFDDRDEDARIEATGREAERLMRESDRATMVMAGFHAFFFQDPSWLLRAAEDPEAIEAENERYLATYLTRLDKLAARIGGNAQLVEINGDLGAQRGPMFGPKTFDRLVRPYLTRLCAAIHAKTDWKIFLHSCGGFLPLIPGVIASGVDVINPVQVAACGMDPVQLKARFGDQLIFWGGGCDTQNVLGRGSPAEVAANVRHLSGILGKGGGFVFNQVHNIMGDVPPANVCAMFDAARACAPLGATAAAAAG